MMLLRDSSDRSPTVMPEKTGRKMEQKGKWLAFLLLGVMAAVVALGWWLNDAAPATAVNAKPAMAVGTREEGDALKRPDFVSEMEWQVLQGVAAQNAEPQKELVRLLGKLGFSKQEEEWQQLKQQGRAQGSEQETARRQTLASALLADIPARLKAGDMDKAAALKLQTELLSDSVSDPVLRAERAEAEAARLETGVLQAQP